MLYRLVAKTSPVLFRYEYLLSSRGKEKKYNNVQYRANRFFTLRDIYCRLTTVFRRFVSFELAVGGDELFDKF